MGCDTFSRDYAPPLDREMFNGSVDADFVLALPFHHGDLEPDGVGVSKRGRGVGGPSAKREASPNIEREAESCYRGWR